MGKTWPGCTTETSIFRLLSNEIPDQAIPDRFKTDVRRSSTNAIPQPKKKASAPDDDDGYLTSRNFREELPLFRIKIRMEELKNYVWNERKTP